MASWGREHVCESARAPMVFSLWQQQGSDCHELETSRTPLLVLGRQGDAHVPSLLPKAKSGKSILDVDPEAQALLEISGRSRHSEGLRDIPEDQ